MYRIIISVFCCLVLILSAACNELVNPEVSSASPNPYIPFEMKGYASIYIVSGSHHLFDSIDVSDTYKLRISDTINSVFAQVLSGQDLNISHMAMNNVNFTRYNNQFYLFGDSARVLVDGNANRFDLVENGNTFTDIITAPVKDLKIESPVYLQEIDKSKGFTVKWQPSDFDGDVVEIFMQGAYLSNSNNTATTIGYFKINSLDYGSCFISPGMLRSFHEPYARLGVSRVCFTATEHYGKKYVYTTSSSNIIDIKIK